MYPVSCAMPGAYWSQIYRGHIVRTFIAAMALLVCVISQAQETKDPASATVLRAWLAAFNSGDLKQWMSFDEVYQPARKMAQIGDFFRQTGGFSLVRVETSGATSTKALVREKNSGAIARMEVQLSADQPPKLLSIGIRVIPPPPDLAPARMPMPEALAAIGARLDMAAASDNFSGAVLIARNGNVLLEKAWGRADRDNNVAVTTGHQFRLGSMNKMFTAVAILQLVEAGKISLDAPIGTYLGDYPNAEIAQKVTVRHLLTHTGGTGDIFGPEFEKNRLSLKTTADYLKLYGERAPLFAPGTQSRYSSYGFVLLGAIIEGVSGMSYYDYVDRNIFQPAGMNATASLPESAIVPRRASGYLKKDGKWVSNADTLPWRGTSAGGGYSTVGDLLHFAEALQSGKLISKNLLAQATSEQKDRHGFGFGIHDDGEWQGYGHGGGAPGMNGELRIVPKQGYVVVVLSNLDPPVATQALDYILARLPAAS